MIEEELFHRALEKPSLAEQLAFLDQVCADQPEVRQRVERLLRSHRNDDSFLHPSVTTDELVAEQTGTTIGPYKLLEQIGEGGMGTVWMAQQTEPVKRLVAVKLIKAGMDSKQVIARFEAERQALALMEHANIARVLDAGSTDAGRPYFVMDLVKGVPITKYCDEQRLTPRQRLELFLPVCQAVQHAHQKGIIHRDLKPSNVLVARYDGKPVPKVIDFGVAKAAGQALTEKTLVTGFGNIVGTLEYMSPEQAEVNQLDIDTRSDIYSLGVLLYELLTGSPPFSRRELEKAGMLEMLRVIREQEPSKPSTKLSTAEGLPTLAANRGTEPAKLTKLVRGELDWIVMKALEKDRNRRYETANGFAMDVRRYLTDEAVLACPPSAGYRFQKFVRRHKAGLAVAGSALLFIVLLGGVVGWGMRDRAAREQEIALGKARDLALTEEGIRQALDRATKSRADLQGVIRKPGGVQHLLNQSAAWELLIKTAQGELAHARRLAVRAEGSLDADLASAIDMFERHLTADEADYRRALRLEKIRLDTAAWVKGTFDYRNAGTEYDQALADFGVRKDNLEAVADRILASPIKEQLLAALDDWAFIALALGDRVLAEQLLAAARTAAPDPSWGDRFRQLNVWRDQKAIEGLAGQAPVAGFSPQFVSLIGLLLPDENRLKEQWLRRAQADNPSDFWLAFILAKTLQKANPVEAAGFYRVALAIRPGNSAAYNNLGISLADQKKLAEAIAAYQKAIEHDPTNAHAHSNLGSAFRKQNKPLEAIAACQKAIALNPKHANAHGNLGLALYDQRKLPEAIAAYEKAIELDPKNSYAYTNLGVALEHQKKLPEAIAAYQKAIEVGSKNASAHYNLGLALDHQRKLPEAIAAYQEAIKLDPKEPQAYNNFGLALYHQGKLSEAIAAYRKAIELDPKDSYPYANLGLALTDQNKHVQAVATCEKAIELDAKNARAYITLGIALRRQKKLLEAIAACEKAIELDPEDAAGYGTLGTALADHQRLAEAIAAFKKAIELAPDKAETYCNLGRTLQRRGQFDEALSALRRGNELGLKNQYWNYNSAEWVKQCERHLELDQKLPAILRDNTLLSKKENLEFGQLCTLKRWYATAASFHEKVYAHQQAGTHLTGIKAAALAGCGQGEDAAKADDTQRARWLRKALEWLQADLIVWKKQLSSENAQARKQAQEMLRDWLCDPDLAGVRDEKAVDQLPESEREAWRRLWIDVAALLKSGTGVGK